jgi:hypothetical protein
MQGISTQKPWVYTPTVTWIVSKLLKYEQIFSLFWVINKYINLKLLKMKMEYRIYSIKRRPRINAALLRQFA